MDSPSVFTLVLTLHVLCGAFLLGHSLLGPRLQGSLWDARTTGDLRARLGVLATAARINPPVAMVLLGTGVYLGSTGTWSSGWFVAAVLLWVVNSVLAARVIGRAAGRLAVAAAKLPAAEPVTEELDVLRRDRGWALAGRALAASDVATLYLMLARPSLAGALGAIVVALALFATLHALATVVRGRPLGSSQPA